MRHLAALSNSGLSAHRQETPSGTTSDCGVGSVHADGLLSHLPGFLLTSGTPLTKQAQLAKIATRMLDRLLSACENCHIKFSTRH